MNTVDKVLKIALNEVGYLEKSKTAYQKNPDIIYEKTAGAGQDNYTKYNKVMHDVYPSVMDFPAFWCDAFVDWCFYTAYGVTTAKSLLNGNFDDYTVASCQMYKAHNALYEYPKIGDQVFFTKNGKASGCHHTGIVYDVDSQYFYTIEGNTSNASAVVSNGGGVAKKRYAIAAYRGRVLFGRPKYDIEKKSNLEIAKEIRAGKWGSGKDRENRIIKAGYDYQAIRKIVNELHIWDTLMKVVGNPYGVAGLMGNMKAESGLNPKNLQNSCEKKVGMDDLTYTKAVDSGAYGNFATDNFGYGLCQWTTAGRKQGLYDCRKGRSIGDLNVQLEFLCKELTSSYKNVLTGLKNARSVRDASDIVLTKFERPKDQSEAVKQKRAAFSQLFFDSYTK